MKLILVVFISILSAGRVTATNYYLSSNGNDDHDGKSKSTAWRTLNKLSEAMDILQSGDSILLERGGVFQGRINLSRSGIYVGAFGFGPKPVVSGSVALYKWTALGKNIWRAECPTCQNEPNNLFLDGKFQSLGRYPNQGYLDVSASSPPAASMSDNSLRFIDGYWNDAQVVIKSSRWTLDCVPVREYRNQTFKFSGPSTYPIQSGMGYFIQRHLSTLDQAGEWYFNRITRQIFIYLTVNPNNHSIEVSLTDTGLGIANVHEVTIENLIFKYYHKNGVSINQSVAIKLLNVEILNSGENGLEVTSCENTDIENCLITDSNNNGVIWHNNSRGTFIHNIIRRTGLHPGRGVNGNGTYIALLITSDNHLKENNLFQNNAIDSTGYIGVDFRTGHTSIKDNLITNFCLTKDDGGGIYTWGNSRGDNVVEGNIISYGIGNGQGTQQPNQLFASGIYVDDRSSRIIIRNNTVSHCSTAGIFLHNAKSITMTGNALFANGNSLANKERGQLYIKLDTLGQMAGDIALHLDASQNKWTTENDASYCVYLSADKKADLRKLGTFNQNQFSARNSNQAITESYAQLGLCSPREENSLEHWQQLTQQETASTFTVLSSKGHFDLIGNNMINNGSMTNDIAGWMVWPAKSTLSQEKKKITDGPSLMVTVPPGETEALLYHEGFNLNKHKSYRLTFSVMSAQPGRLEFVTLMADSPWGSLGASTCFFTDSTYRTYTYFFKPDKSYSKARVNFKSTATFWIDSVSLFEIEERDRGEKSNKSAYAK